MALLTYPACWHQRCSTSFWRTGETNYLNGADSLFSIVQMPKGVPVATFAIGNTGAFNAALEAVAILAAGDENLTEALYEFRRSQEKSVLKMHNRIRKN